MRSRAASALLLLGGTACWLGCTAKKDENPPYIATCDSTKVDCRPGQFRPGTATSATGPTAGAGGQGSDPSMPSKAVAVSGSMELYRDELFSAKAGFAESVTVSADGALGARVSALYSGNGVFRLDVAESSVNWFSATPETGQDVLTTLWPFDTKASKVTNMVLARSSAIDSVFSFSQSPVERSAAGAHVILNVLDGNGLPLAGVAVGAPPETLVAYAAGLTWTTVLTETGASGRAFVGNLSASVGTFRDVTLTLTGSLMRQLSVRVEGGAVSVVSVRP